MNLETLTRAPHTNGTQPEQTLVGLELFAGAGGLALATHGAGFTHVGLVEWDAFAVETLRENSRRVLGIDPPQVLHSDAREVNYGQWLGRLDLLSGGPPCQPFSTGGSNGGYSDERNMFPAFLHALSETLPKAVLVENVKGLVRQKWRDYFNYVLKCIQYPLLDLNEGERWQDHYRRLANVVPTDYLDCEQYVFTYQVVDSADYGVPQRRERVIITAFRKDLGIQPFHLPPSHSKEALLIEQWNTGAYWERHGIQPIDYLNTNDRKIVAALSGRLFVDERLPWITVRDAICDLDEPVARGEEERIPNHIQHPGARIYPPCHTGSSWDYPAKALKAGTHGTPGGENILRVDENGAVRYFTTREAARLHTFPDAWHFHGTWGACIKQLGNAVPVELGKRFAQEISKRLKVITQATVNEERHDYQATH